MARFYFDLCNGGGFLADEEGRILESAEEARAEAWMEIRALAAAEIAEGRPLLLDSYVVVREENGNEFTKVYFSEAIEVRQRHPG